MSALTLRGADNEAVRMNTGRGGRLTADFQVHVLAVLTDGVAGGAEVLAGIGELDVLQGERGHACMAAHHHVPIEALQTTGQRNYSHLLFSLNIYLTHLCTTK